MQTDLRGRDMITEQEWTLDELETVFDVGLGPQAQTCPG